MRAIVISEEYVEKELKAAIKTQGWMQKDNLTLNAQYYSGRIAMLRELMDLPKGEIG